MLEIVALFAIVIFLGFFAEKIFGWTKIPEIFLLLIFGLLLGPLGGISLLPGMAQFSISSIAALASLVAVLTLVVILFDAGTGLEIPELIKNAPFAFTGTLVNFIATTAACFIALLLAGWYWLHALLVAVLLADTAEEVVFSLIAKLKVREWVRTLLIFEGAFTSTLIGISTILFLGVITTQNFSVQDIGTTFFGGISIALVVGALVSYAWVQLLVSGRVAEHRYLLSLAMAMILYAAVEALKANGVIAVLIFGLAFGSAKEKLEKTIFEFHREITFLVRSFFFVYLGVIISFDNITPALFASSVFAVLAMMAGRLAGLQYIAKQMNPTKAEFVLMAGALPCGLATAVFATVIQNYGVVIPGLYEFIFLAIFESILLSIVCTYYYMNAQVPPQPGAAKPTVVRQTQSKAGDA